MIVASCDSIVSDTLHVWMPGWEKEQGHQNNVKKPRGCPVDLTPDPTDLNPMHSGCFTFFCKKPTSFNVSVLGVRRAWAGTIFLAENDKGSITVMF